MKSIEQKRKKQVRWRKDNDDSDELCVDIEGFLVQNQKEERKPVGVSPLNSPV
jgi:hypothetical protein